MENACVLFVEPDPRRARHVEKHLRQSGELYEVERAHSEHELDRVRRLSPRDIVVVVLPTPQGRSPEYIETVTATTDAAVLVAGSDPNIRSTADALACGARDHVRNPDDVEELAFRICFLGRVVQAQADLLPIPDANRWETLFVAGCSAMKKSVRVLRELCAHRAEHSVPPVLVTGETGTGKGLVAGALHSHGRRHHQPYVHLNCATLPSHLVESELFGHAAGAFTGAQSHRRGLVEQADGGVLFLDEIGSLDVSLQGKLLTLLDNGTLRRVGADKTTQVDTQFVAATNSDLDRLVEEGHFRRDLYYRLSTFRIHLPPLRERIDDIPLLAELVSHRAARAHGVSPSPLTPEAIEWLQHHAWPGNIRELANELTRVALNNKGAPIDADDLELNRSSSFPPGPSGATVEADPASIEVHLPNESCSLEQIERRVIQQALAKHNGNRTHTAKYLQISRDKLISRMRRHGLYPSGS